MKASLPVVVRASEALAREELRRAFVTSEAQQNSRHWRLLLPDAGESIAM